MSTPTTATTANQPANVLELAERHHAQLVTDVLSPAHVIIVITIASGLASGLPLIAGLAWGLTSALFAGIIPYAIIIYFTRNGTVTDVHIRNRSQRIVPLLLAAASVTTGVAVLLLTGAPTVVLAVQLAMLAGLALTLPVTFFWKVSMHTAVAACAATISVVLFGPLLLATFLVVALIGWSRVHLKDHTTAQVIVGTALGVLAAMPVILL